MLCRLKIIVPKRLPSLGLHPRTTERHKRLSERGVGPVTPEEKYLGNVIYMGFCDFMVMFVDFIVLIVFILYHPNLLLLFSINKSVFIWF